MNSVYHENKGRIIIKGWENMSFVFAKIFGINRLIPDKIDCIRQKALWEIKKDTSWW